LERLHLHLSRRESQIMDVIYQLGEATAEEIRTRLPDRVANNTVRVLLKVLEQKGHLTHRKQGPRYVYQPTVPVEQAKRSALRHMLSTYFGGSAPRAMATLLDESATNLSDDQLAQLQAMIDAARKDRS